MQDVKQGIKEDVWVHTICARCYNDCAIQVHRVNGVAVEIQGSPDSTQGSEGGLCSKGLAGLQILYDPNRLNVPLRRTNPEKGIGVDPKWKEITWEEAYDEIVPRMKKLLEEDPKKVGGTPGSGGSSPSWGTGAPNYLMGLGKGGGMTWGGGLQCGGASHPAAGIIHGAWSIVPDFKYCNYALYFGATKGHGAGHSAMIAARLVADARASGMKMVVFDPMCNTVGGKATEWVPIIPGTDLAVILAMCNVIVNDLGILDKPFLKLKTNAPYLVGSDLKYVRENGPARGIKGHGAVRMGVGEPEELTFIGDDETNKPMVWDAGEGKAKVYDDPTIEDYALEGEYEYNGVKCQPSFAVLKEHLKQYTPEMASEISSIPAEDIRRIATEFATEARVGSTITIDGHELPYRPVSAIVFKGGEGHGNAYHTCFAVGLISSLVGAMDVPGGTQGWPAVTHGYPGREDEDQGAFKWTIFKGVDGFLQCQQFGPFSGKANKNNPYHGPWPIEMPELKHRFGLVDIQPASIFKYIIGGSDRDEVWEKLGATDDYRTEMLFLSKNPLISVGDWDALGNALSKIPFIVITELFNTETTEAFADIVLPDTCYLEKDSWSSGLSQNYNHAWGMDDWAYHITQKVVEPLGQRKTGEDVTYEIAKRLGKELGRDLIRRSNERTLRNGPIAKEYWPEDLDRMLTASEIGDAFMKSTFGPEYGWEWFKEHGYVTWPKKVEEAYWMWFLDLRVPIYLEWLAHMKPAVEKINEETGLIMDPAQYTPLLSWFPATIHTVKDAEHDLYCYSYRDSLHSSSQTMEQPWIDEASNMNPWVYNITMNADTGKRKGVSDGDTVEVENYLGNKVTGKIKLMQGHHPLTVAIAGTAGHFAKGQPIAYGKGANFNKLLPMTWEHTEPITGNLECCVRVTVRKIS